MDGVIRRGRSNGKLKLKETDNEIDGMHESSYARPDGNRRA
jgi:hypothetical protein